MPDNRALKSGGLSVSSMIKNAADTPKVYSNHANHPGYTTSTFNQLKAPVGNPPPNVSYPSLTYKSNVSDEDLAVSKAERDVAYQQPH
jgi:hypothetical protein